MLKNRRWFASCALGAIAIGALLPASIGFIQSAYAQVGGNLPTRMTTYTPTLLSGNRIEAKCRITTLDGGNLAGLYPVELYYVYPTYSVKMATISTDNSGYAKATLARPPSGTVMAWNYAGNGAYSRPLHQATAP